LRQVSGIVIEEPASRSLGRIRASSVSAPPTLRNIKPWKGW